MGQVVLPPRKREEREFISRIRPARVWIHVGEEESQPIPLILSTHHSTHSLPWCCIEINSDLDFIEESVAHSSWLQHWFKGMVARQNGSCTRCRWKELWFMTWVEFQTHGRSLCGEELIGLGSVGYRFFSCFRQERTLKYDMYYRPFRWGLWITVGVAMFTLSLCYVLWESMFVQSGHPDFGQVILLLLSSLVEDCHSAAASAREKATFRLTFGPWFLLSVVLNAGYVGVVIEFLNVPPQPKPYDEWKTLPGLFVEGVNLRDGRVWRRRTDAMRKKFPTVADIAKDLRERHSSGRLENLMTEVYSTPVRRRYSYMGIEETAVGKPFIIS